MKKMMFFLFTIIMGLFFTACTSDENDYWGTPTPNPTPGDTIIGGDTIVINDTLVIKTPVWVDITGNGDTIMRDGEGDTIWLRPDWFFATLTCQDTVKVSSDTPWTLNESEVNPKTPSYDWGGGVTSWGYNHRVLSVTDSIYGIFRGRKLPLWKPERLHLEQMEYEPTTTDSTSVLNVEYVLSIGNILLAHRPQVLCTSTGNVPDVPEFQAMLWKAWHVGPATAIYADGQATVTCRDTLVAYEVSKNGEIYNSLNAITHSKNNFKVWFTSEVKKLADVIGKELVVKGDTAYAADFKISITPTSKEIVEKILPYTYNDKAINFIDSLKACGYKLYGGQVISYDQVRMDMIKEDGLETVSFTVNPNLREIITVLRTEASFAHGRFVTNPVPQGNNVNIVSYDVVTVTNYMSNGTTQVVGSTEYSVSNFYTSNFPKIVKVSDLQSFCGRYNLVEGKVNVQGYEFSTTAVSTVTGDAIVDGKNYKEQAPACSITPIAVTINQNSLVYEYQGSHDGHSELIKVTFPIKVMQIKLIPGKIRSGYITDSYTDQYSQRVTWEIIKTQKSNKYYVLSKMENEISYTSEEYDDFGVLTDSDVLSYWYGADRQKNLGTLEAIKIDQNKESYLISYKDKNKSTVYIIGKAEDTLAEEHRHPVRAILEEVVIEGETLWTFDGITYYKGTED